ncbi:MAG TPA: methionyl-tRNA formyltransferase [Dehalococcoidia bacterium]|nr:methionyl-tRNA formyltransferase [Dehalococcoidia bacterium]
MPIVFIGTPEFAVPSLRALVSAGYEVSAVYTQPDRPAGRGRRETAPAVKIAAQKLGLQVEQPESLRDPGVIAGMRAFAPEVMVGVAYGQLIRPDVLAIPPKGILNVHPSLLPRWRGASPVAAAILAGDEDTGVTIMRMDEGLDSGPVIAQKRRDISPGDTTGTLTQALAEDGAALLVDVLPAWLAGETEAEPQDESRATVCRQIKKSDGIIDWTSPADEIGRRVRAYNPWPGAQTSLDGEKLLIWEARPVAGSSGDAPGTVVGLPEKAPAEAGGAAFGVETGDGLLAVISAQRSGRRAMGSDEFLRGMPGLVGRRLG